MGYSNTCLAALTALCLENPKTLSIGPALCPLIPPCQAGSCLRQPRCQILHTSDRMTCLAACALLACAALPLFGPCHHPCLRWHGCQSLHTLDRLPKPQYIKSEKKLSPYSLIGSSEVLRPIQQSA